MVADPSPSIDAAGATVAGPRASLVECPDACLSLVAAIADGQPHPLTVLAAHVRPGQPDGTPWTVARVGGALDTFRRSGMRLERDAETVRAEPFVVLSAAALRAGADAWDVRVVGATGSTNDALMSALRAGAALSRPRLFASEMQLAGRGRLGRRWTSAPGASLTASFALRIARGLARLDGITLVCGLAVRDVAAAHGVRAELKWPNDVLFGGRKLGGILVEAHAVADGTAIVVGIGLNVAARDAIGTSGDGLAPIDLAACGGRALDRNRIVGEIASRLQARLDVFARTGFATFVDEWNGIDAFADTPVAVAGGPHRRARHGIARGVDAGGALMVELDGVRTRIISGDISVRPLER